jgi:hypothetical protein
VLRLGSCARPSTAVELLWCRVLASATRSEDDEWWRGVRTTSGVVAVAAAAAACECPVCLNVVCGWGYGAERIRFRVWEGGNSYIDECAD